MRNTGYNYKGKLPPAVDKILLIVHTFTEVALLGSHFCFQC
jgi:hypothetical protein